MDNDIIELDGLGDDDDDDLDLDDDDLDLDDFGDMEAMDMTNEQ
jgi:hypothetical protein